MKKLFLTFAVISLFVGGAAIASTALNTKHKCKQSGGAAVNCVYCHTKASIPKPSPATGQYKKYQTNATCKAAGCH